MKLFQWFLFFVCFSSTTLFACNRTPIADPAPANIFTDLDNLCLENLGDAISEIVQNLPPVLIAVPDHKLILYRKGKTETVTIATPLYQWFKAIDHISFGLYPLFYPINQTPIDKKKLEDLRAVINQVKLQLPAFSMTQKQRDRQNIILDRSLAMIDKTLQLGRLDASEYKSFFRGLEPLLMENTDDAGFDEMDAVHAQVKKWKKELSADDWAELTVLILASQLMKKDNNITAYFSKILNTKEGYGRLIYLENMKSVKEAINQLGLIRILPTLSELIFDDETRLFRDIFADTAIKYLQERKISLD